MPSHNSSFYRSLPLSSSSSSSENNVVLTCLYKASTSQLDVPTSEASPSTSGILSPRTLYAQYSDSSTTNSRETRAGHRFRKDLNVLTGYDTTAREEEFDALPVTVRRKYFSTLERLRFAQGSRSSAPGESHAKEFLLYEPRSTRHYRDYKSTSTVEISQSDHHQRSVSNPREISSLAERRGKRLERLKLRRAACAEPQQQIQGDQTSAASVLSYQPSMLRTTDDKAFSRGSMTKPVTRSRGLNDLDTTGRTVRRKNPISHSHILSPKKESFFPSPNCGTFSTQRESMDMYVRLRPRSSYSIDSPASSSSYIRDSFCWEKNEDVVPKLLSLGDGYASLNNTSLPTDHQKIRPSARRLTSANNLPFERVLIASPSSTYLEYLPTPCLSARSRAHSSANMFTATWNSEGLFKNNESSRKKTTTSMSNKEARLRNLAQMDTQTKSFTTLSPKPATIAMKSFLRDNNSSSCYSSANDSTYSISEDYTAGKENLQPSPKEELGQEILDFPLSSQPRLSHTSSLASTNSPNNSQRSNSGTTKPMVVKKIDSSLASGTNQMTLRMTLTRPDLRLDEAKIYAWQDSQFPYQSQNPTEIMDENYGCKGPLDGPDGWGLAEKESGVVKRLWNKVTQNRKILSI